MSLTISVEDSALEIELIPPSSAKSAHLIIRAKDPDHSLVVFLHEAPALRDALGQAMVQLAELKVKTQRKRG